MGKQVDSAVSPHPAGTDSHADDAAASIVVADGASVGQKSAVADFFTFDPVGGFTWWAGAVLGALACCAFASIIIIAVRSHQREAPAVLSLMTAQQCPLLSLLQPAVAYEAWATTCASAHRGYAYPCQSQVDCVVLGPRCAPAGVLAGMQCLDTGARADHHPVCAYPIPSGPSAALQGFCTQAGTSCALCTTDKCAATTPSYGSVGCPPSSACGSGDWVCNPI